MSNNPNLPTKLAKAPSPQPSHFTPTPKTLGSPYPIHVSPKTLSDKDLYARCQLYGGNAKKWLQKFAGLLPEVYRRFLYKKHGCGSIQEFALKLSGMHQRTTDKILNLHKRLVDKPNLLALFESGEQGWSKLEAVTFLATSETEKDLAEKVKMLPFHALVVYVKSQREKITGAGQAQNNLEIPQGPASDQLSFLQGNNALSSLHPCPVPATTATDPGLMPSNSVLGFPLAPLSPSLPAFAAFQPPGLPSPNSDQCPADIAIASPAGQTTAVSLHQTDLLADEFSIYADSNFMAPPSLYPETFTSFSFPISIRSRQKLNIVKLTLEKQHRQTLAWNQVIALWPIHNQKIIVKEVCPSCALKLAKNPAPTKPQNPLQSSITTSHKSPPSAGSHTTSRHIPEPIKNLILATHGQTCAFPNCNKAFTEFHHAKPFAIYKSHHPNHIFPVCSTHHTLFHAGLIENHEKPPTYWTIRAKASQTNIDKKAMKIKMNDKN